MFVHAEVILEGNFANSIRDSFSECGTWPFIDYIRGLFTVLYFIFGCVPHFDLACYFDMVCKYIKYIL